MINAYLKALNDQRLPEGTVSLVRVVQIESGCVADVPAMSSHMRWRDRGRLTQQFLLLTL